MKPGWVVPVLCVMCRRTRNMPEWVNATLIARGLMICEWCTRFPKSKPDWTLTPPENGRMWWGGKSVGLKVTTGLSTFDVHTKNPYQGDAK